MSYAREPVRFSPEAQNLLLQPTIEESRPIVVLAAMWDRPTAAHLRSLQKNGLQVRAVVGDVLTADLSIGALRRLATLDFIRYVELARPMFWEEN
jgi:hypothetical protein